MLDVLPHKAHSNVSGFTLKSASRSRFDVGHQSRSRAAPKSLFQAVDWPVVGTRYVNSVLPERSYGRDLEHLLIPTIDRGGHVH
jgi:hypothetical protein